MPFADPTPTPADISFRLFGFPVRIHPFFWLMCVLIGPHEPRSAMIWTASVLISILVHELGHTVLQRRYGGQPYIVLYGFGGLAYGNGADDSPRRQILISLAGPIAGFLLAAVLGVSVAGAGHDVYFAMGRVLFEPFESGLVNELLLYLFYINIWWGLLNLLPIYPLDGGQVARALLLLWLPIDRSILISLWLSIISSGLMVASCLVVGRFYTVVMFVALAVNNYQTLEAYRRHYRGGY